MDDIRKLRLEFHNRESRIKPSSRGRGTSSYLTDAERQRILAECDAEIRQLVAENGGQRKIEGVGAIGR